jgi:hypothetical protein
MTRMNAKTFLSMLTFAGIAALAVVALRHANRARAASAALEEIAAKDANVLAKLRQTERQMALIEQERAARRAEIDALRKRAVAATSIPAPSAAPARRLLSILELIRNEPDAEMLYLKSRRAQLAARYGPLLRSFGLSAEMTAKFQDNHIKREEARMDLDDVLRTKGADESGTAVAKLRADAEAQYNAAQRELLGDEGFRQLQDYEDMSSWRATFSAIAGVAAVEHVPFSAVQADALVRAISDASRSSHHGQAFTSDVDWQAFDMRARAILSADQYAVLNTMDPGPTRGGFLQTRMYALVEMANQSDAKRATPVVTAPSKPSG